MTHHFCFWLFHRKAISFAINSHYAWPSSCLVELKMAVTARLDGNDPWVHSGVLSFYHTWWFCEKWALVILIQTQLQQNAGRNSLLSELAEISVTQRVFFSVHTITSHFVSGDIPCNRFLCLIEHVRQVKVLCAGDMNIIMEVWLLSVHI